MQSNSTFDPASLLDTEYEDDLNTRLTPVPEGEYYARIKENSVKVSQFANKNGGEPHSVMNLLFVIEDEEVKRVTQLQEPQVRMSVFLELKPGTNQLLTAADNPNANVRLGRLKEALGIKPGKKWSPRQFEGMGCFIKVKQKVNPDDIEDVNSEVQAVSKESNARRTAA